jgi:pyrroline-5-carboxylate reductase
MSIAIIGGGRMGEALAQGLVRAALVTADALAISDVVAERVASLSQTLGVRGTTDNRDAVQGADCVILAVKPAEIGPVCRHLAPVLAPGTLVVSIAAGIPLVQIAAALARTDLALARAMPNTPCLVRQGAIGVSFAAEVSAADRARVRTLLSALGVVEEVSESLLDAVTGLSGSGPAYVALFIEALADGGVLAGLPRAQALRLAAETVRGTAALLLETGQHPAQLKDAVASPGGTTIAGLAALEAGGFRHAAIAAVTAATARAKALAGD